METFQGLAGVETAPVEGKQSYLTNLRAAEPPPETWSATWDGEGTRMTLFMAGALDRLVQTDAPGWRTYKGDQLNAPPITELLAERSAEERLTSTFAAVMAPHS